MPADSPPASAARTLPVIETVRKSYKTVFSRHLRDLPRALAIPLLLSLVIQALTYATAFEQSLRWFQGQEIQAEADPAAGLWSLALAITSIVPLVLFGVAWTRLILLGPDSAGPRLVPSWNRRHWRSFGCFLLVSIMTYLCVILAAVLLFLAWWGVSQVLPAGLASDGSIVFNIGFIFLILFLFAALYTRWSFIFPAIAVDESFGLRDSWRLTKGQAGRLILAGILTTAPLVIVTLIMFGLALASVTTDPTGPSGLFTLAGFFYLLNIPLSYLYLALLITMVAIAFKTVTGWVGPTTAIADVFK